MKRLLSLIDKIAYYYNNKQIPLSSAALCYYMTMTTFPLIICLYTLLGYNYERAIRVLEFAESFLSFGTVQAVRGFLAYVEQNHNTAMLYAGIMLLLTSSSAAVRSIHITIGRMQGGQRYHGIWRFVFSLIFAVAFLVVTWFAILVMFTSKDFLTLINRRLPFIDISGSWLWIKYLLLGGILFLILWGLYRIARKREADYSTWPGAILATLGMLGMSLLFSAFIAVSARYSLVYGSLASIILLMLWLYFSCQVIYIGAAFNISLRDIKKQGKEII